MSNLFGGEMKEMKKCPICNSPLEGNNVCDSDKDILTFYCLRCGMYNIEKEAIKSYEDKIKRKTVPLSKQIAIFSGWIRENQNIRITNEIINEFYSFQLPTLEHRAANLLKSFTIPYDLVGGRKVINFVNLERIIVIIKLNNHDKYEKDDVQLLAHDLKYMAATWSYDINELKFIYRDYLMDEKKYLEAIDKDFCKITLKGWAYLESLRQANPDSKKAFVAMWFTDEMNEICEKFIKKAATDAGNYKAEPINKKDFNGDINDEIIGEIRSSKFIIADFTGNRGGVYFEAGFAYGLKKEVIYTCNKDWWNKVYKKRSKLNYQITKGNLLRLMRKDMFILI